MSWHYLQNEQPQGPVKERNFIKLVKQGVITAETYLWCEGMPDWKKYGELFPNQSKTAHGGSTTLINRPPQFGIFNLKGDVAESLIAEDIAALEPVLGHAIQSTDFVPKCDVLFVYCNLDVNGLVQNSQGGLREIIRDSGAVIVVVASENHGKTYVASGGESRGKNYGKANIVMTLQRNGRIFPSFFARLFTDMKQRGVPMQVAYGTLCPQVPNGGQNDVPGTIYAVEGIVYFINDAQAMRELRESAFAFSRKDDAAIQPAIQALVEIVWSVCREDDGAIRPVEAISAMSAITGERCIFAADEIDVCGHSFFPGQRVFSDVVNELIVGSQLDKLPAGSVFGTIRDQLAASGYEIQFPDAEKVLGEFAKRIGKPEDWGKVPLSLPVQHYPNRLPLRIAFDTRARVEDILKTVSTNQGEHLRICAIALAVVLIHFKEQIDRDAALTLALETINGMAKTIPMKNEAVENPSAEMLEAQHQALKIGYG